MSRRVAGNLLLVIQFVVATMIFVFIGLKVSIFLGFVLAGLVTGIGTVAAMMIKEGASHQEN